MAKCGGSYVFDGFFVMCILRKRVSDELFMGATASI